MRKGEGCGKLGVSAGHRVGGGVLGRGKARLQGVSEGQEVAASRRAESETRCVGEVRQGWVAYEMETKVAERRSGTPGLGLWGTLRAGAPRGLGSGSASEARIAVEWAL